MSSGTYSGNTGGMHLSIVPRGPVYVPANHPDVKDPSIVFDGLRWHLFGTGCGLASGLELLHVTAPTADGPWEEQPAVVLVGVDHVLPPAAPGVIAEGEVLHMFLQHDFNILGGSIEHLTSEDGGRTFVLRDTALTSLPGTCEAGVYDPDPAYIDGHPHLAYAAMAAIGQPELFVARST